MTTTHTDTQHNHLLNKIVRHHDTFLNCIEKEMNIRNYWDKHRENIDDINGHLMAQDVLRLRELSAESYQITQECLLLYFLAKPNLDSNLYDLEKYLRENDINIYFVAKIPNDNTPDHHKSMCGHRECKYYAKIYITKEKQDFLLALLELKRLNQIVDEPTDESDSENDNLIQDEDENINEKLVENNSEKLKDCGFLVDVNNFEAYASLFDQQPPNDKNVE